MRFLTHILVFFISITTSLFAQQKGYIPQIIFDTDMGPDYDDVGAIALLHALADSGECEILACVSSVNHPVIAPTIDFFNHYFNRPQIPVGEAVKYAPDFLAKNSWNVHLLNEFPSFKVKDEVYPAATDLYRKILENAADQSVTIVTVGFLSNLDASLKSSRDKYSKLTGKELVQKKVKNLICMAGAFPSGSEFNMNKEPLSAQYVFNNWPGKILFSGFEIGKDIHTGSGLSNSEDPFNPVAWSYRYNSKTYKDFESKTRQSWDQTAVLVAVRPADRYFYVLGPGHFLVDGKGRNTWNPDVNKNHYFIAHKYPTQNIEQLLDSLMEHKPVEK